MLVFVTLADTTAPTWDKRHAQRDHRFFYYHRQSWRRAGSFGAVDVELCFSKRRRAMSSVGQTTIPDPGRTWCYRRGGSAYPKRGPGIARGLGLRSYLSTTFVAYTRRSAAFTRPACVRAASGQAAAPPRKPMNSRRLRAGMGSPHPSSAVRSCERCAMKNGIVTV